MPTDRAKKLILVVEDEPDQSAYLVAIFEDRGFATRTAPDGNRAMAAVKEGKPDLITLDMSMPEKSGIRFYRELKDQPDLAGIPVVVITGVTGFGGSAEDFQKFIESRKRIPPPDGFIPKPVDRDQLMEKVGKLLA